MKRNAKLKRGNLKISNVKNLLKNVKPNGRPIRNEGQLRKRKQMLKGKPNMS